MTLKYGEKNNIIESIDSIIFIKITFENEIINIIMGD